MIKIKICKFKTKKGDTMLCARVYINGSLQSTIYDEEFIEYSFGVSRETMNDDIIEIIYERRKR